MNVTTLADQTLADLCQHWEKLPPQERAQVQAPLAALNKLRDPHRRLTVAAFGLVNRGKSALLNALLGDPILQVGPLNGVTRQTHRLHWIPSGEWVLDLLDTPGLNEVEGQVREQLAWSAAQQADLILFVIAGDLTQIEYAALLELQTLQKPILVVFNKVDLFPDHDREAIYAQITSPRLRQIVSPSEILMVAAAPKPNQVRIHWPDGTVTQDWERPVPSINDLRTKIEQVIEEEGEALAALNRLRAAQVHHDQMLDQHQKHKGSRIQQAQWQAVALKSISIGLSPLWILDLALVAVLDMSLVYRLLQLYHVPAKSLMAYRDWLRPLGVGLGMVAILNGMTGFDLISAGDPWMWAGMGVLQGLASGWWTQKLGRMLEKNMGQGSLAGPGTPRAAIKTLLGNLSAGSIMSRLDLSEGVNPGSPQ